MTLVRVVAPHFVAGFVVTDDRVTESAPILRYLIGWESQRVRAYVARKGWRASVVPDAREAHRRARMLPERHSCRVSEDAAMSQQWPDPNDPNPSPSQNPPGEAPGAPHTPETPRQTPEPRDPHPTQADDA